MENHYCQWISSGRPLPLESRINVNSGIGTFDRQKRFPEKLWEIIQGGGEIVRWSETGTAIIVDSRRFSSEVMDTYPGFVQVAGFANLRRQLREYGFDWRINGFGEYEFRHQNFLRDRPDLLSGVKTRRRSGKFVQPRSKRRSPSGSKPNFGAAYEQDKRLRPNQFSTNSGRNYDYITHPASTVPQGQSRIDGRGDGFQLYNQESGPCQNSRLGPNSVPAPMASGPPTSADSSLPPMWYPNYWCERQSSDPAPLTPQSQVPVCVNPQQPCLVFNKVKPQPILGLSMSRQQLVQPTQDGAIPNSNFQSQNATRQSETIHPLQQAPLVAVDESQLEGKSAPIVPETSTGLQHAARQFLCESAIAIPMTDSGSNKIHATFQGSTFMNFQLPPNADAELSETVHQLQQQISDGSLSVVPIPFNMMPLSSTNDFQESLKFQAASTHELSDASDIVQQPTSATPRSTDSNLTTSQSSFTEDPYRKIISPDKQPVLTRPLDQTVTLDSEANVPVAKNPVECCESALAATRMAKEHNVPADYTGSLPQDTHCGEPKSIPATELFTTETNSGCEEVQPLPIRFLHSLELATASPANSQMIPANVTTTDTLSFSKTTADNV